MKKFTLLLVLLPLCKVAFAQFPAPVNFGMDYTYVYLDDTYWCGGTYFYGPGYCTSFYWEAPDLSETDAQLIGYNIYYKPLFGPLELIGTTTETFHQKGIGIMGDVWVTAIYANPEGESEPSNIGFNEGLPLGIKKVADNDFALNYNQQSKTIEINGIDNVSLVEIIDLNGKIIQSLSSSNLSAVDVSKLSNGIYLAKLTTNTSTVVKKFRKE
jgi:hypothetical protein